MNRTTTAGPPNPLEAATMAALALTILGGWLSSDAISGRGSARIEAEDRKPRVTAVVGAEG